MSIPLITVVGNRPQFIKAAPLCHEFKKRQHREFIIHTGQHYDHNLSQVFFDEMNITTPDITLQVTGRTHGKMTSEMLVQLEEIFTEKRPRGVLLFGDTNSTLAAALAAVKLKIPIAHVESGPRIYDIHNPEEINRVITDKASQLLFCPDQTSVSNLAKEAITQGVYFTGDLMYDAYLFYSEIANKRKLCETLKLDPHNYVLVTIHRPENTDEEMGLKNLLALFKCTDTTFVLPLHPRTQAALKRYGLWDEMTSMNHVKIIEPVGYLDLLSLLNTAQLVLTDSGGLQKEAYFSKKPVLLLFHKTPWPQIEEIDWQKVVGTLPQIDINTVSQAVSKYQPTREQQNFFGDGKAAKHIVDKLEDFGWLN